MPIGYDDIEEIIYWDQDTGEYPVDPDTKPYGSDTARIIDEDEGGVIAYCHKDSAFRIVDALRRVKAGEQRAKALEEMRILADKIEAE